MQISVFLHFSIHFDLHVDLSESCSVMSDSLQPMEFSSPEYWSG